MYSENPYGPVTNFARTGTGPQPGGYRPLIYNNMVSRCFSKMLFAENLGRFSDFILLSLFKKVTEISSETVQKVTTVPKSVSLFKSVDGTDNGTKKVGYRATFVPLYPAQLWASTGVHLHFAMRPKCVFIGLCRISCL